MRPTSLEHQMRAREAYHSLRLLPGAWVVLRVDGHGFSRFTKSRFEKPFDLRFHELMVQTAEALLRDFQALYSYTESDEISVLFRPGWDLYDRELEKLVSLSAGVASSTFTLACGEPAHFDSRVWLGVTEQDVVDYFRWRQADATRCALNGWCYWTLRKEGQSVGQATATLQGKSLDFKNEMLWQRGINFNDLPAWQRRGTGLYWEAYEKLGVDPRTQEARATQRRRVKQDRELPMKEDYAQFLRALLERSRPPSTP